MVKWASFEEKLLTVATEGVEKETAEISCKIKEKKEVRVQTCVTKVYYIYIQIFVNVCIYV
jgi:hypothetical protein